MSARDLVGYGANPPVVKWPNGARIASQWWSTTKKAPSIQSWTATPGARPEANRPPRWVRGARPGQRVFLRVRQPGGRLAADERSGQGTTSKAPSSPAPWPWSETPRWAPRSCAGPRGHGPRQPLGRVLQDGPGLGTESHPPGGGVHRQDHRAAAHRLVHSLRAQRETPGSWWSKRAGSSTTATPTTTIFPITPRSTESMAGGALFPGGQRLQILEGRVDHP